MSITSKKRHLVNRTVTGGVLVFIFATIFLASRIQADVYSSIQKNLSDHTNALVDVLSQSVAPGGVRAVQINGNNLLIRRYVNPAGDESKFHTVWKATTARKDAANKNILAPPAEPDPLYEVISHGAPYRHFEDNMPFLIDASVDFFDKQSRKLQSLVINALETPFTYETQGFRAIASIPVKAIDAESVLTSSNAENGYLFLAEKLAGTTESNAFWQIQFGENFKFSNLFAKNDEDVQGEDAKIARYPGSIKKLVFSENANGWHSTSWSYESTGDVLSHISHYVSAFASQGYSKENRVVIESDYALVQFAKPHKEATLFVELLDSRSQDVQVTLQLREN